MRKTPQIIGIILLGGTVLGGVGILFNSFVLNSYTQLKTSVNQSAKKLIDLRNQKNNFLNAKGQLLSLSSNLFGTTISEAYANTGIFIDHAIKKVTLDPKLFSRTPIGPYSLEGCQEVGWIVNGQGSIQKIFDFLFILQECPLLHKIQFVNFNKISESDLQIQLAYTTIVPYPMVDLSIKPMEFDPNSLNINESKLAVYRNVFAASLFSPSLNSNFSITRTANRLNLSSASKSPSQNLADWKVVSISMWGGEEEVHIRDVSSGEISRLKPGDVFLGIKLVAVDFRILPSLLDTSIASPARLIIENNGKLFAVEIGSTLAQQIQLTESISQTAIR